MFSGRAAFAVHPQLQAGVEGTTSFTSLYKATLNDNANYSAGLFATWQPAPRYASARVWLYHHGLTNRAPPSARPISAPIISTSPWPMMPPKPLATGSALAMICAGGVEADAIERKLFSAHRRGRHFKHASLNFGFSLRTRQSRRGQNKLVGWPKIRLV